MSAPEVTIINYGVGNILSVQRSFEHVGARVVVTKDPEKILSAQRIVLPGVGAFSNAMQLLNQLNLCGTLHEIARKKTPLLRICLGMQLLFDQSEEFGITQGLGLISGKVISLPLYSITKKPNKIPHIGWNELLFPAKTIDWEDSFLQDVKLGDAVYFVHSFMVAPENSEDILAVCSFNGHLIPAAIFKGNIMGCQFHPEKSGDVGLKILRKFLAI